MKKVLFIILIMFLMTGCTVDYELKFNSNRIVETIDGKVKKDIANDPANGTSVNMYYDFIYNDNIALVDSDDKYKKSISEEGDYINFNLEYTYKNNLDKSRLIRNCFENYDIKETKDYLYVKLSGAFGCLYDDEVTVNVKTDYAVMENNADKVKDNKYTWILTSEDNESIELFVSKNIISNTDVEAKPNYFRIIGFIVLIVLSGITYFLYKKKNSGEI